MANGGTALVTVEGVKDKLGLALENKVVTVYDSALNGSEVKVSDDYTLALGEDVKQFETKNDWIAEDKTLTYQENTTLEGYKLSSDKKILSYVKAIKGTVKVELSGVISKPTFDETGKVIHLFEKNIEENISIASNAGEYEFEIENGNYSEVTFGGNELNDTVTNNGSDIIIDLSAGNDKLTNKGANVTISGGAGNDKINNTGSQVSIAGGAGNDNVTLSGGDAGNIFVYNVGDGKDNLFNKWRWNNKTSI